MSDLQRLAKVTKRRVIAALIGMREARDGEGITFARKVMKGMKALRGALPHRNGIVVFTSRQSHAAQFHQAGGLVRRSGRLRAYQGLKSRTRLRRPPRVFQRLGMLKRLAESAHADHENKTRCPHAAQISARIRNVRDADPPPHAARPRPSGSPPEPRHCSTAPACSPCGPA